MDSMYLFGYGNNGELVAFDPHYLSLFSNNLYVLETRLAIYYRNGPNTKLSEFQASSL